MILQRDNACPQFAKLILPLILRVVWDVLQVAEIFYTRFLQIIVLVYDTPFSLLSDSKTQKIIQKLIELFNETMHFYNKVK